MVVQWKSFVHKPTPVKAFCWDGSCIPKDAIPEYLRNCIGRKVGQLLGIQTLHGCVYAEPGDYIVLKDKELYPVKGRIFRARYEGEF